MTRGREEDTYWRHTGRWEPGWRAPRPSWRMVCRIRISLRPNQVRRESSDDEGVDVRSSRAAHAVRAAEEKGLAVNRSIGTRIPEVARAGAIGSTRAWIYPVSIASGLQTARRTDHSRSRGSLSTQRSRTRSRTPSDEWDLFPSSSVPLPRSPPPRSSFNFSALTFVPPTEARSIWLQREELTRLTDSGSADVALTEFVRAPQGAGLRVGRAGAREVAQGVHELEEGRQKHERCRDGEHRVVGREGRASSDCRRDSASTTILGNLHRCLARRAGRCG